MQNVYWGDIDLEVPDGFIVFISGVPGVGKSTISYELLKKINKFRIIEETDIMREILRGYGECIKDEFKDIVQFEFDRIEIIDYINPINMDEAVQQCKLMYKSFENIIRKQQRKGISSIINGVHIVPDVLQEFAKNKKIMFVNLYINDENELYKRIKERDPNSYLLSHLQMLYKSNTELHLRTLKLCSEVESAFSSIDITALSVAETLEEIENCIKNRIFNPFP